MQKAMVVFGATVFTISDIFSQVSMCSATVLDQQPSFYEMANELAEVSG